jgi:hypothetical protein
MNRLNAISFRPQGQLPSAARAQSTNWNVDPMISVPVIPHTQDRFTPTTRFSSSREGSEIFFNPKPQSGFFQALVNRISHNLKPSH